MQTAQRKPCRYLGWLRSPAKAPSDVYVDMLIDFKEQAALPVAMRSDGKLIEVWDGDFGERTPGEWFEQRPLD